MFKNAILIHGIGGLSKELFFPKTKTLLESFGLEVFMPSLKSYNENISYDSWKDYFDKKLKDKIGKDTIVVAQSLGTQFIVKYLHDAGVRPGLYISCCAPRNIEECFGKKEQRDRVATLFIPTSEEFESFKQMRFEKHSFFSDNDTFFSQGNLEAYADAIGAQKHLVSGKAHFNFEGAEHGVAELEEFLKSQIQRM